MHRAFEQAISARLRERLKTAQRVFVLTGAGVSAESGVPTFRGGGGAVVWKGMPFSVISSAIMVEQDLLEVWAWFDYRRAIVEQAQPNPAHLTLARWQDVFAEFTLATQNVDGLHELAGSRDVLELHGQIWRARCLKCSARRDLRTEDTGERPPKCRACGGEMRPDVVLFGEFLPTEVSRKPGEPRASATFASSSGPRPSSIRQPCCRRWRAMRARFSSRSTRKRLRSPASVTNLCAGALAICFRCWIAS